jgi:hypothetical protein
MIGKLTRPITTALATILLTLPLAHADQELEQRASWSLVTTQDARQRVSDYLIDKELDDLTQARIEALWPAGEGAPEILDLLDNVTTTMALVEPQAKQVVDFCRQASFRERLPTFEFLKGESLEPFVRYNLRLLYGRWLAQHHYYDESLAQVDGLKPEDVVDPAALLFYQAAGYHRLLKKDACLPAVSKLLENESVIPTRYATVARLMKADLEPLKIDSLDEISRLMDEVRRRLDLHRAGKRVRDQEDEIIAKLDKLIKKLEEQQQSASASAASNLQPSNPAQESLPMGGKGPGNVDPKDIGARSGWGNLPPKERQEALQQIGKDLPAHYREVIEEYFRKLAREGGN